MSHSKLPRPPAFLAHENNVIQALNSGRVGNLRHALMMAKTHVRCSAAEAHVIDEALTANDAELQQWASLIVSATAVEPASKLPVESSGASHQLREALRQNHAAVVTASPTTAPRKSNPLVWIILVALVGAGIGVGVYYHNSQSTVVLANGFNVDLQITIGETAVTVPKASALKIVIASGTHHVVTKTASGQLLEEFDHDFPGGSACNLYNVFQASPIVIQDVEFHAKGRAPSDDKRALPRFRLPHGSTPIFDVGAIDYVLQAPPNEITLSKGATYEKRDYLDAVGAKDWTTAMNLRYFKNLLDSAAELALKVATVEPQSASLIDAGGVVFSIKGPAAAKEFGRVLITRFPRWVDAHRLYQQYAQRDPATNYDELVADYRQASLAQPDSADAGYLFLRLLPSQEAQAAYEKLVLQHPKHAHLRRGLLYLLTLRREFGRAIEHAVALRELDKQQYNDSAYLHVTALAGQGKAQDALTLAEKILEQGPQQRLALAYADLAERPNLKASRPSTFYLARGIGEDKPDPIAQGLAEARMGRQPRWSADITPEVRQTGMLLLALNRDPREAVSLALADSDGTHIHKLIPEELVLLALETARGNPGHRAKAIEWLQQRHWFEGPVLAALKELILTGERKPWLAELPLECQAAVDFVESRKVAATDPRHKELRAAAAALDVLKGIVSRAMQKWPEP